MAKKVIKPDFDASSSANLHWQDSLLEVLESNTDKSAVVELPAETVKELLTEFKLIGKKINRPSQVFPVTTDSFPFQSDVHYRLECFISKLGSIGKSYDRYNVLHRILIKELPQIVTEGNFLKLNAGLAQRLDKAIRNCIDEDLVGDKDPANATFRSYVENLSFQIGRAHILPNKEYYLSKWDFYQDAMARFQHD
ncbi:hypothetical protein KFS98_003620 [Salmonella enterica]|nr:hypothetical protein [Salmonella enterica]